MSNFDSDSDSDSYIHQKTNVENWYTVYENEITVKLIMLTNEIVNDLDFSVPLNDYDSIQFEHYFGFLDVSILDINNLLKKFHQVKHIHFPYWITSPIITLSTTVEYLECNYNNFTNLEEYTNLKNFKFSNDLETFVMLQFADGLKSINITCKTLEGSLGYLPQSVESIYLEIKELNASLDMWPSNLKKLTIRIGSNNGYTIEMLPHTLEHFSMSTISYLYNIEFPPYLKLLHFLVRDVDSPYITGIPDTVVNYAINYISQKEIDRLPKKCKKFTYLGCPLDIHKNLMKNVKGVAFYTNRIKDMNY